MNNNSLPTFEAILKQEGLAAGIRFLNKRVLHRFSAIYRLDGEAHVMRSVLVIDKEGGAGMPLLAGVPLADSFCQFVIRDGSFVTSNSAQDYRLAGHKYQNVISSYVGLPLNDSDDKLWGSFCHMDVVPRPINDQEVEFLGLAALRIQPFLQDL